MSTNDDRPNPLRAPILKAVAEPPMLFLVPLPLFAVNLAICFCVMTTSIVLLKISPLSGFLLMFIGHGVAAMIAQRDAHIVTKLRATGKPLPKSRNIYPTNNKAKYHP